MERLCDVISDILSRLPTKSVVRFMSVNNHFYNIISDPRFAKHHGGHSPKKVEGLFHFSFDPNSTLTSYTPLCLENPREKLEKFVGSRDKLENMIQSSLILDSCNGLVLLGLSYPSCYCVLNPTTNKFQLITRPVVSCSHRTIYHLRLASDPTSFDYKLVQVYWERFLVPGLEIYSFRIFSSDTNSWRQSKEKLACDRSTFLLKGKGVYLNGSVHWARQCGDIMAFDVKKEQARIIKLPQGRLPKDCLDRAWFGVVGGLIYLVYVLEFEMVILVLRDYKNGRWWCVKNQIKSLRVNNDLYPIFFDDQWLILKSQNISSDILAYNLKSSEWWRIGKLPDSMELDSTYAQDVFFPFAPTLAVINDAEFTSFADFLISREPRMVDAQRQLGINVNQVLDLKESFDFDSRHV